MTGGRLRQYGPGKADGAADKGLERQYEGTDVGPTPRPVGPAAPVAGGKQFEPVPFDQVAGGPGNAHAGHGGHGKNSGAVSLTDKAAPRGHHQVNFDSVKGHGAAKRGPGKKTPPTTIDKGMD